ERVDAAGGPVALKILKPPLVDTDEFEARVEREVKNARRLDHAHAVHVWESGRLPDGRLYYAMEFCPGRSLRDIMREGPLAADRPFTGAEPDVVHGHLQLPPPSLVVRYPERVTDALERAIWGGLEKSRDRRYPTAQAFAEALLSACPEAARPAWRARVE